MSADTLIYRPIETRDYTEAAQMIKDTWQYEKVASPRNALHMASVFLYSSLAHHNFSQVAIRDGKVVGLILGRTNDVPLKEKRYYLNMSYHLIRLLLTSEGKQAVRSFRRNLQVNQSLLKQTYETYDGELTFFAVDASTRQSGIGSHLFYSYLTFMKNEGARTFRLFTDTSCTYGFYESKGMTRIGAVSRRMPFLDKEMSFFLYRGDLQELKTDKAL